MKKVLKTNTGWKDRIRASKELLDHIKFNVWFLQDSQT
jgi:hypothetical protein